MLANVPLRLLERFPSILFTFPPAFPLLSHFPSSFIKVLSQLHLVSLTFFVVTEHR